MIYMGKTTSCDDKDIMFLRSPFKAILKCLSLFAWNGGLASIPDSVL